MNPFITLTSIHDKARKIRINVNHIVSYHQSTYSNSPKLYTVMLVSGGQDRNVRETLTQIDDLINNNVLSIPFTGDKS